MSDELPRPFSLERIVFFSDAVFAIAATLLVVDLRLPELAKDVSDTDLAAALGALMPRIFAYLLSFLVIGLYWLAHWRRFHYIERADERLAFINLLLLGCIAFIPFPTSLIGEHGDRPLPVIIYAVSLSVAGLIGSLSWLYAARAGLVVSPLPTPEVRLSALRGLTIPIVMLGSLLAMPFFGTYAVEALWFLLVPFQAVFPRLVTRIAGAVD